jgi:hypothetical protein
MSGGPFIITDELRSTPGSADALRIAYLEGYAPAARARGMTLLHAWRTPPLDLLDGTTMLSFVWSVADLPGWWRARLGAAGDPAVLAWWDDNRSLIAERRRLYHEEIVA